MPANLQLFLDVAEHHHRPRSLVSLFTLLSPFESAPSSASLLLLFFLSSMSLSRSLSPRFLLPVFSPLSLPRLVEFVVGVVAGVDIGCLKLYTYFAFFDAHIHNEWQMHMSLVDHCALTIIRISMATIRTTHLRNHLFERAVNASIILR